MSPGTDGSAPPPLVASRVSKTFRHGPRQVSALVDVSFTVTPGCVNGLLGPDGAGKTTLIRIAAGLLRPDSGGVSVLGMATDNNARAVQAAIGYMPQRFGLYEDLSVQENLDLYADLQGVSRKERLERYPELMRMTNLAPFTTRLAGRLSGGMKQKLGLACSLIKIPRLLLLDEPTVGVDPLSRRELWSIVDALVRMRGLTVLLSTAYLDEAERCDRVFILQEGALLGEGPPQEFKDTARGRTWLLRPAGVPRRLQSRLFGRKGVVDATLQSGLVRFVTKDQIVHDTVLQGLETGPPEAAAPVFEDGFMLLLRKHVEEKRLIDVPTPETAANSLAVAARPTLADTGPAIMVRDLERRFGDFHAVQGLTFTVDRGEIFGLLGANGAGKSTTFRMLCGLLPPTGGRLQVAGADLRTAAARARKHVGYMAQKFSLYGQLSVRENLTFFSNAYGLAGKRRKERLRWALEEMELAADADAAAGNLPFGIKQRLALACALLHEPAILFLDEPTSGVDPLGRRLFWERINALVEKGVTVVVTTHFMEEAEYCDRMLIMESGRLLAMGAPEDIRKLGRREGRDVPPTIEEAFIHLVEQQRMAASRENAPCPRS